MTDADQQGWLNRCEIELDNIRAAIQYLLAAGEAEWGLRLGAALFAFWEAREHLTEGLEALVALLAMPGSEAPTSLRAHALFSAAVLADAQRDYPSGLRFSEQSLEIYRQLAAAVPASKPASRRPPAQFKG